MCTSRCQDYGLKAKTEAKVLVGCLGGGGGMFPLCL
jgi:hypothetical protein